MGNSQTRPDLIANVMYSINKAVQQVADESLELDPDRVKRIEKFIESVKLGTTNDLIEHMLRYGNVEQVDQVMNESIAKVNELTAKFESVMKENDELVNGIDLKEQGKYPE